MSYVRWSSPLKLTEPCPECERPVNFPGSTLTEQWLAGHNFQRRYADRPKWARWAKKFLFRLGDGSISGGWRSKLFHKLPHKGFCRTCTSNWYIFWHSSDATCMEDELLAVWPSGGDGLPIYTYREVKRIVANNEVKYMPGFEEHGDQGVLMESLVSFLSDVEEQYAEEGFLEQREADREASKDHLTKLFGDEALAEGAVASGLRAIRLGEEE